MYYNVFTFFAFALIRSRSINALSRSDIALTTNTLIDVFTPRGIVKLLILAAFQDAVSDQLETLETLHSGFVRVVVCSRRISYYAIGDFGKHRTSCSRTHWNVPAPSTVAHAKNYRWSASDIARFAFVTNDCAVGTTQAVEDGHVCVWYFRKRRALRR